jgi:hypothetical protein
MGQRFEEQDTLKHTKQKLRELRDMNNRPGRELLAYLLEMALIEVTMTASRERKALRQTRTVPTRGNQHKVNRPPQNGSRQGARQ